MKFNEKEEQLIGAVATNNSADVKRLIAEGADINKPRIVKHANVNNVVRKRRVTFLLLAIYFGHFEVAKSLIDAGADINAADNDGKTILMQAAKQGEAGIFKMLLDSGANIHATDSGKWTALMWAADTGRVEITKILLDAGANIQAKNNDGKTALDLAPLKISRLIKWHLNGYRHAAGLH